LELKLLPFCQISVQYVFIEEMYGKRYNTRNEKLPCPLSLRGQGS